ncbi:MAG TPA: hypothetical protein VHA07_03900, partial [Devosia sp.]|nr:hypothetical protein [Devosia sp.]
MAGTFVRWFIPGIITVAAGTALAVAQTGAAVTSDLTTRAEASLQGPEFGWARVSIEGRDAVLTGTAADPQAIADAVSRLNAVTGIRTVVLATAVAQDLRPYPFSATLHAGRTSLAGAYPTEAIHRQILAAAPGADDSLRPAPGARADYAAAVQFGLAALANLEDGEVALSDDTLTVTGRAKSLAGFEALQRLPAAAPPGVVVGALAITPPLASPYRWEARFDGTALAVSGNVPDAKLADRLRALAPANVPVSAEISLASGEPSGFADKALALLNALLKLESGEATITDGAIALHGVPATPSAAEAVREDVAAIGGTADLEPPRVAEFSFGIDKTGDGLTFSGFVTDAATKSRLAGLAKADVAGLALGRGAPDKFSAAVDFGLTLLSHVDAGKFSLKGNRLSIGGRSSSAADFNAALQLARDGVPPGFSLAAAELHPPIANPFTWSAVKDGARVTLSGDVPNDAVRQALLAKAGQTPTDAMTPADGAPDNFAISAGKGLDVLALLDSGSIAFDGASWSIKGKVDTPQKAFAADAAYSVAGLRTAGWTYTVEAPQPDVPAVPIIAPYTWRAQKSADGAISFAGYVPSDDFRSYLRTHLSVADDATALGAGAPADFEVSAKAGLEALVAMDEGALSLAGNRWILTGTTRDSATRTAIQSALGEKIKIADWQIAIQAGDAAQVISPYAWTAIKGTDGSVEVSGYLPSDALRTVVMAHAGPGARDTTTVASGDPPGFSDDVLAGLDALAKLQSGKAAFDGSRWHLTGTAGSRGDGEAAVAALVRGSNGGAAWDHAIAGLDDQGLSSSPPPSSAAGAESSDSPDITTLAPASSSAPAEVTSAASSQSSSLEVTTAPSAEVSSEASGGTSSSSSGGVGPEPSSSQAPTETPPPAGGGRAPQVALPAVNAAPQMPSALIFEADRDPGAPIVLSGVVPDRSTAGLYATLAGGADVDGLEPRADLPADFGPSGAAGVAALAELDEGRLGFDGNRWWLQGKAQQQSVLDDVKKRVAALPHGTDWSIGLDLMTSLDVCRMRVDAVAQRNAIVFQPGKAALVASSMPVLDELAGDLNACPDTDVHVQGHTDS